MKMPKLLDLAEEEEEEWDEEEEEWEEEKSWAPPRIAKWRISSREGRVSVTVRERALVADAKFNIRNWKFQRESKQIQLAGNFSRIFHDSLSILQGFLYIFEDVLSMFNDFEQFLSNCWWFWRFSMDSLGIFHDFDDSSRISVKFWGDWGFLKILKGFLTLLIRFFGDFCQILTFLVDFWR